MCRSVCLDATLSHICTVVYALMPSCTEQYLMHMPWCMPWCQAVQSNISCMCHGVCFDVKLYRVISHVCAEVYALMSSCTVQYLMYVLWCMPWCQAVQSNISCTCHGVCFDAKLYRAISHVCAMVCALMSNCTEQFSCMCRGVCLAFQAVQNTCLWLLIIHTQMCSFSAHSLLSYCLPYSPFLLFKLHESVGLNEWMNG